ncbi:MAG: UDP-N-acetylmuramoyl-L-alanyl-D-glutamate--2,6-diaminopimelate ligase [Acidimicrobiales bacterium]
MAVPSVALSQLVAALGPTARLHHPAGSDPALVENVPISGVTHDSRQVQPGWLFCCVPGGIADGHRFADEAAARGAAALLVQRNLSRRGTGAGPKAADLPQIEVHDSRASMAVVAATFWGHPAASLRMAGVTGTNGKTTVTQLLGAIFRAAGQPSEIIGTLSAARTTPEAPDLQRQLAELVAGGVSSVAMEVSSHALALHRVDEIRFDVATFTNLSRDHLDFHGTMAAYFAAKAKLFEAAHCQRAVVNLDDPHGRLLRDAAVVPTVGYRLADAEVLELAAWGTRFRWRGRELTVHLAGRHNLSNALAAATTAEQLGIEPDAIAAGLDALQAVPGRFEHVDAGQGFGVIVDYAHTPDALERVLSSVREMVGPNGRVIVVFGCGGDRDRTKRAPMGQVAAELAELSIITSDNPRHESPQAIADQVRSGAVVTTDSGAGGTASNQERSAEGHSVVVELDRRVAIGLAFEQATAVDVVVIAGKGHERTQQIGDTLIEFDDRLVARELLGSLGGTPDRFPS